jgi:hypothetical protein
MGEALLIPIENPDFLRPNPVEEKRRVGRYEELRMLAGSSALLSETRKQPGMEKILWLFDTDKLRRMRIVQDDKVREHLESTVG